MSLPGSGIHRNAAGTQAAFAYGSGIHITDLNAGTVRSIPLTQLPVSLCYTPDEGYLLAISEDGVLSRYRVADGELCASIDLSDHHRSFSSVSEDGWHWVFPEEDTLLAVCRSGGFLLDISGQDLKMRAIVSNCIGYDPAARRFLIGETALLSSFPTRIGCFPQYTLEELVQTAASILNK